MPAETAAAERPVADKPSSRQIAAALPYFLRMVWRASPRRAAALAIAALVQAPMGAATVFGMSRLIDGLTAGDAALAWQGVYLLVGAGVIGVSSWFVTERNRNSLRYAVEVAAELQALQHIARLPYATLEDPAFQRVATAYDRNKWVLTSLPEQMVRIAGDGLALLGYASAFTLVPWPAALAMVVAFTTKLLVLRKAAKLNWEVFDMETREGRRGNYYENAVRNHALPSRLIGITDRFIQAWRIIAESVLAKRDAAARQGSQANLASGLIETTGFGAGLVLSVRGVTDGGLPVGTVAAFVAAYRQAAMALDSVAGYLDWFLQYAYNFPLIKEFFEAEEESDDGRDLPRGPLTVQFEDVWFRYPGTERDVLCGTTFALSPGEDVALVGLNGAGKSTLLKLLMGTYRPTRGRILVNGVDASTIRPSAWRRAVAMLPQDMPAYDDTVEGQVLYGDHAGKLRKNRFAMALAASGLKELAESLPRGTKTHTGRKYAMPEDEAIELSGGQRQIVAIARTLYQDSQVYVFDEPTSAVDAEKEERFFESLPEALAGRTAVFVAHRFSTIRRAKRIVVMDAGRIIEDGTHEELMAKAGRYAELFTLQARLYQ